MGCLVNFPERACPRRGVRLGCRMSVSAAQPVSAGAPPVDVVPLGGLGEFGLNMMAISCGETTIVIDAGSMFPGDRSARASI